MQGLPQSRASAACHRAARAPGRAGVADDHHTRAACAARSGFPISTAATAAGVGGSGHTIDSVPVGTTATPAQSALACPLHRLQDAIVVGAATAATAVISG